MRRIIFATAILLCLSSFSYAQSSQGGGQGSGRGDGLGNGNSTETESRNVKTKIKRDRNESLRIVSKPRPGYTEVARKNQVQGVVRLRIVFKKDGEIGNIKVVKGLPDGLNERAVKAAKLIRFLPERRNGKDITVSRILEFSFNIY